MPDYTFLILVILHSIVVCSKNQIFGQKNSQDVSIRIIDEYLDQEKKSSQNLSQTLDLNEFVFHKLSNFIFSSKNKN